MDLNDDHYSIHNLMPLPDTKLNPFKLKAKFMKTTVAIILESLKQKFNKELLQVEQRQREKKGGEKRGQTGGEKRGQTQNIKI